ncbi:MAG TPA: DNA-3-methyladenine glycosylase I [Candidatus Limiplasma sp.]|nr:DNA-3-methyladenine glycosylase I [Candidatus Limiplasma sp.]HRX07560.1 DNA-3-methyladenine glycosylase I [Candidatus Limiplasma sp.]
MPERCAWARGEKMIRYHDEEWGKPEHDDGKLAETLLLEGFQAGLSWAVVLNKRENFRKAFADFDPVKIAAFGELDVQRLTADAGIVRNRLKIEAAIRNMRVFLEIQKEFGSFDRYLYTFAPDAPIIGGQELICSSPLSDAIAKDLKKRGMRFMGTVTVYSFLQAVGVVNDHDPLCDFKFR